MAVEDSILPNGPDKTITRHIGDALHPARENKAGIRAEIGNLADILRCGSHVRFTPESRHVQCTRRCLLCANSGHRQTYSITSSARPISVLGMLRPSALAVLRLRIISTFVACCTGRSETFSPLRMRPV